MINTLFLPELREMLVEEDAQQLREFCEALHPARTADYMEGLTAEEAWGVLRHAPEPERGEIFGYLDRDKQLDILRTQDRAELADLVAELAADDRVDILKELEDETVDDLLERMPVDERRDIQRLTQYPEETAGAMMTTEVAKLSENWTVKQAFDELSKEAEDYETIYYLYIIDDEDHLRGVVTARQLVTAIKQPETRLSEIMDTDIVSVEVMEDQEHVANKVARLDLLAIPVVDNERHMLGIITHDDVIDVVREEATEDAHRIAAVDPLDESYLRTHIFTLSWKRGIWLALLFFFALLTAIALKQYEERLDDWIWLAFFLPLIISSGGNTGSQSATLIITALSRGHVKLRDWRRILIREFTMGLLLGLGLALMGLVVSILEPDIIGWKPALVVPLTLLLVVVAGTLTGGILPLIFQRIGWDPALMSNPFVAGIIDVLGILIYMNVAIWLLGTP